MFEFLPTKEIRDFNTKDFVGKFLEIKLCEISKDEKQQWIVVTGKFGGYGWVPVQGKKDTRDKMQSIFSGRVRIRVENFSLKLLKYLTFL